MMARWFELNKWGQIGDQGLGLLHYSGYSATISHAVCVCTGRPGKDLDKRRAVVFCNPAMKSVSPRAQPLMAD